MKFAVIDIGSNTAKIEFFKYKNGALTPLEKISEPDRIAAHKEGGELDEECIAHLVDIIRGFCKICGKERVKKVFAYATQSLRGIKNADKVCLAVYENTGIKIDVLSGEDEARLGFLSFSETERADERGVYTDMGGGSTEVTCFDCGKVLFSKSLPFGSLSLTCDAKVEILPDDSQKKLILDIIRSKADVLPCGSFETLYASGGTTNGIFKLYSEFCNEKTDTLSVSDLKKFLFEMEKNKAYAYELAQKTTPQRYDSVFTGLYAHLCLLDLFDADRIVRCDSSCRIGYAAELIKKGQL